MRTGRIVRQLLVMLMMGRGVAAQGTVSGSVSLEERPGAEKGDITTAVVYLSPRGAIPASERSEMRSATIEMKGREFIPHVRIVQAGGMTSRPFISIVADRI